MDDGDISKLSNKVSTMQTKLNELREVEANLDRLCHAMKLNYVNARKNPENEYFAYVTRNDIINTFGSDCDIFTIRNCNVLRQGYGKTEADNKKKYRLAAQALWKELDVRLVTEDGETYQVSAPSDQIEVDDDSSEKLTSVGQPKAKNNAAITNSRRGRRRKPDKIELKDDDDSAVIEPIKPSAELTEDEKELEERRITGETLLCFRPPPKQRKREYEPDWLESTYKLPF